MTNGKGKFELRTMGEMQLETGAYAGEHIVTIAVNQSGPGGFGVILRTPEEYADKDKSKLRLTVSRSAEDNKSLKFELKGELKPMQIFDAGVATGMANNTGAGFVRGRAFGEA